MPIEITPVRRLHAQQHCWSFNKCIIFSSPEIPSCTVKLLRPELELSGYTIEMKGCQRRFGFQYPLNRLRPWYYFIFQVVNLFSPPPSAPLWANIWNDFGTNRASLEGRGGCGLEYQWNEMYSLSRVANSCTFMRDMHNILRWFWLPDYVSIQRAGIGNLRGALRY